MLTEGVDVSAGWLPGEPRVSLLWPCVQCTARMEQYSCRLLLSWGDFTQNLWCVAAFGWGLSQGNG